MSEFFLQGNTINIKFNDPTFGKLIFKHDLIISVMNESHNFLTFGF